MTSLNASHLALIALNAMGCTNLESLDCSDNNLSFLTLTSCTALDSLDCSGNQLPSLTLTPCTALRYLDVSNNQLDSLILTANTALETLRCGGNTAMTALNILNQTELLTLDISGNTSLTSITGLTATQSNQRKLQKLFASGCTGLTSLDCTWNKLDSLDVSGCTALETLKCNYNQLPTLDVSGLTALKYFECNNNQLTSLNMSGCTSLYRLECASNLLTTLDLTAFSNLGELTCTSCRQLSSLNVAGLSHLRQMFCENCNLTALDLSGCSTLDKIECGKNNLSNEAVDTLIATLCDRTGNSLGVIRILDNSNAYSSRPEGNVVKAWHAVAAGYKNWKLQYSESAYMWNYMTSSVSEVPGDVDRNGRLNVHDVSLLTDMLVDRAEETTYADINGDTHVSLADLTRLVNTMKGQSGTINGHDYVDLALPSGTKWATCDVGATAPETIGTPYSWGETTEKTTWSWENYAYCEGTSTTLTKYNTNANYGVVDNLTQLQSTDDAATVNWGTDWCTPTSAQQRELLQYCEWTEVTVSGTPVWEVKSIVNDNFIIIPKIKYWSSTCSNSSATVLQTSGTSAGLSSYFRYYGHRIRPVLK